MYQRVRIHDFTVYSTLYMYRIGNCHSDFTVPDEHVPRLDKPIGKFTFVSGELIEYCLHNQNHVFNASCPTGSVVIMESARYGRMRQGACVTSQRDLQCFLDELTYMHGRCSGRRTCQVLVPDAIMQARYPCPDKELNAYLEAAYRCQTG